MATKTEMFDLVVLGAGPAGENVADVAHARGLTLFASDARPYFPTHYASDLYSIERHLVGGECSYYACIPSKALLRAGAALRAAQRVDGAKQAVAVSGVDVVGVLRRRDYMTSGGDDKGQVGWLKGAGIELFRGVGKLAGPKKVEVLAQDGSTLTLEAKHAVCISTGTVPLIPPIPGLEQAGYWTNREATSTGTVPKSLLILGGGVVACEMATAYASFGCRCTVLVRGMGLLERMEPFAGEGVGKGLKELGVDVRFAVDTTRVDRVEGEVVAQTSKGEFRAEEILVATGRKPATADLGLPSVSVGLGPGGYIPVDDTLLVSAPTNEAEPWLYALGDVNGRALLTHMGKYQGRQAGEAIAARARGRALGPLGKAEAWGRYTATADEGAVPQIVYTDPEVASVGLTAAEAEKRGRKIRVVDYALGSVAGSYLLADGYAGHARWVVDRDRQVILGATLVGQDVGELVHAATVMVVGEVAVARLWHAVPSFPGMGEVWLRLLEGLGRGDE
ncbi:putative oxidoreductase [Calocera cornea HHB12733]|uniref:Putative oxidoreductase n=1 Tax=Calocera cornea HHB12733 TaxID=1353952 RepID=A0A165EC12_9BASI|nr:putative oxidoreductase [Calocera cornea HHB12733]